MPAPVGGDSSRECWQLFASSPKRISPPQDAQYPTDVQKKWPSCLSSASSFHPCWLSIFEFGEVSRHGGGPLTSGTPQQLACSSSLEGLPAFLQWCIVFSPLWWMEWCE